MSLAEEIKTVKHNNPGWKSNSRIVGRAGEIYCGEKMKCVYCDNFDWLKCATNEKSKDLICNNCNKKYQIKCKKATARSFTKIVKERVFTTVGAEYHTTLESLGENIDYIILLYQDNYEILGILHARSKGMRPSNIIPRNPLSEKAKRCGWQGCYLNFNDFTLIPHTL